MHFSLHSLHLLIAVGLDSEFFDRRCSALKAHRALIVELYCHCLLPVAVILAASAHLPSNIIGLSDELSPPRCVPMRRGSLRRPADVSFFTRSVSVPPDQPVVGAGGALQRPSRCRHALRRLSDGSCVSRLDTNKMPGFVP